ncbi:PREDICTED: reverse mRNAase [Prunus dulcis]|uniref:PREDICTED: reverse mRNAase n=2 Tax=Prunus dulcis TaxID=3755 RepID=A0A5E4GNJ0_PRUDU|nr:PREDICTED: reverse mRNAase [Prunus dulcis]
MNDLEDLQKSKDSTEARQKLEQIKSALESVWKKEEIYWSQRARIQWLKAGDQNTKIFHLTTVQRRQKNRFLRLRNESGGWLLGEHLIGAEFRNYFSELFKSAGPRRWGNILDAIPRLVTDDMNSLLTAPFSEEEVSLAAHQLGAFKAPGPDGFQGASPETTSQFLPISLCNSSYKILSKVLANQIKSVLPEVISESQTAFVQERQIQDNIIVAHEAFHYLKLKRTGCKLEAGLKIDMSKAFDRVEWDFLVGVMQKLGFSDFWINMVMACVSTVSFSVLINGKPGEPFQPTRGLRQGDPFSPYLFLIISEALSRNIMKCIESGEIKGIRIARGSPTLSHLFFADD